MFKYLLAKNDDIPQGSAAFYFGFSAIVWFVIGTGLGAFNAAKLAFPDFVHGLEFVSFGHMRQVHVHAVIFGWISMAFAMAMMYMTMVMLLLIVALRFVRPTQMVFRLDQPKR